jgi:alkylated DNA repair protein (DNA oxidative demethylase)
MILNLFDSLARVEFRQQQVGPGATVLRKFAVPEETPLLSALREVVATAQFRHMITPAGFLMARCDEQLRFARLGDGQNRLSLRPHRSAERPALAADAGCFLRLATGAAVQAGFSDFVPDACLIDRYAPGAKMSLQQDKNAQDLDQPVSVSLGIPVVFLFGGLNRADKAIRVKLTHGDVVVWGGPTRLRYHGVLPLKEGHHPLIGDHRINLTFRKAA